MQIMVNGQTYDSWEAVPADIRAKMAAKLPDANNNGVPDLFEGGGLPTGEMTSTAISVDGQSYDSVAALPPEIQALLRGLMPGAVAPPATQVPAGQAASPAVPPTTPLTDGQVMLNGVPTQIGGQTPGEPKRKHWWQRG